MKKAVHVSLAVLLAGFLAAAASWADTPGGKKGIPARLQLLEARLAGMEMQVDRLITANANLRQRIKKLRTRLETAEGTLEQVGTLVPISPFIRFQEDDIDALSGPHLIFEGLNVHVRSGFGATDDGNGYPSGLGNLVVGYNMPRDPGYNERSGSHNIIVGDFQNFSAYGGLVAGSHNTVSGNYACITGGRENAAVGAYSSISGGHAREAAEDYGWRASSFYGLDPDGAVSINSASDITLKSGADTIIQTGSALTVTSVQSLELKSHSTSIRGNAGISLTGTTIGLNSDGSGQPAARLGDTVSGGAINTGSSTVLIGE
ncbi:MAG TPA: hypothetical protein VKO20_04875 [Desulfosalsimonadaceae bacterium]|nr:hypothetical protein [Desulfosalsimonadaceae bacterium]